MLGALRVMTVERGIDPRGFALMPFGGAGPLHACGARPRAGHPPRPLPARLRRAVRARPRRRRPPRHDVSRTVMLGGSALDGRAAAGRARRAHRRGPRGARRRVRERLRVRYELRYRGQSFELTGRGVRVGRSEPAPRGASPRAHEQRYGYRDDDAEVELVNVRVSVWGAAPRLSPDAASGDRRSWPRAPPRSSSRASPRCLRCSR